MERIIEVEEGEVLISDPFLSDFNFSKVIKVSFNPKYNQGWGVSKEFPVDSNIDNVFINAFVEEAKGLI